jgi:hypothetical protein
MLLQHYSIGHAQYVWNLRQNPKIVRIFSTIWNRVSLLTSFDGVSYHFPHEVTKFGAFTGRSIWLHTDQSFTRNDFECIQSFVTGYDVNEGDASLKFLEGSGKFHAECREKFGIESKDDWYKLNADEMKFYMEEKGCKMKCVKCKAGDMVLWDSRTIHCGTEPLKNREKPNFRHVVYICMLPRKRMNETLLKKRRDAFEEMRMTTHSGKKLFPKTPRTYGNPLPTIHPLPKPTLSKLGMKLVGW